VAAQNDGGGCGMFFGCLTLVLAALVAGCGYGCFLYAQAIHSRGWTLVAWGSLVPVIVFFGFCVWFFYDSFKN
jgi:hypothetical protein